jgi:uncharacterized membrane protein SpoIIM required for sporulation
MIRDADGRAAGAPPRSARQALERVRELRRGGQHLAALRAQATQPAATEAAARRLLALYAACLPLSARSPAGAAWWRALPVAVRRARWPLVLAASLFASGFAVAYVGTLITGGALASGIVPAGLTIPPHPTPAFSPNQGGLLDGVILTNNLRVALLAFGTGVLAGLPTAFFLAENGALLGALAALYQQAGHALFFWSLIAAHGSLELPAVCLAGAAGFVLAQAALAPGDLPRAQALGRAGLETLPLMGLVVALLAVAAAIESFFTPSGAAPVLKIGVGFGLLTALAAFVALGGRQASGRG